MCFLWRSEHYLCYLRENPALKVQVPLFAELVGGGGEGGSGRGGGGSSPFSRHPLVREMEV